MLKFIEAEQIAARAVSENVVSRVFIEALHTLAAEEDVNTAAASGSNTPGFFNGVFAQVRKFFSR
ncbi:MAG: hypothetical protein CMM87_05925 [Rickettsiales bacterium]|nr:hypothetical protein [Rickettsiales bacterium]|tara:strand:- start:7148 stop:7342 length:195 start_codon:yes stop_codon:yes gene_type:complete